VHGQRIQARGTAFGAGQDECVAGAFPILLANENGGGWRGNQAPKARPFDPVARECGVLDPDQILEVVVKITAPSGASETDSKIGWTVGRGAEYAFSRAWSVKAEYLYADIGKSTCDAMSKANIVRGGLNCRF
jgi:opacity protein-like surface antigen